MTTPWVAKQMEPEYLVAKKKHEEYVFDRDEGDELVVVHGAKYAHALNTSDWSCDCSFAVTMQLPCRHAIAYRLHHGVAGSAIPLSRIDER
jgi:hypothetical protein